MSLYKNEMKKRGTKKTFKKRKKNISSLYENANLKKGDEKKQKTSHPDMKMKISKRGTKETSHPCTKMKIS